jgi:hypothetical protein
MKIEKKDNVEMEEKQGVNVRLILFPHMKLLCKNSPSKSIHASQYITNRNI